MKLGELIQRKVPLWVVIAAFLALLLLWLTTGCAGPAMPDGRIPHYGTPDLYDTAPDGTITVTPGTEGLLTELGIPGAMVSAGVILLNMYRNRTRAAALVTTQNVVDAKVAKATDTPIEVVAATPVPPPPAAGST